MTLDVLTCRNFQYDVELGFHDCELGKKQKVSVDLEALVLPLSEEHQDKADSLPFDYYKANRMLKEHLLNKRFNLIETLADEIAKFLLKYFEISQIKVCLTKKLIHVDNAESVSYACVRRKET